MMARVKGSLRVISVPTPSLLEISMVPRKVSMVRLTTSMPTPRPETLVTSLLVEKPGWKMT